MAVLKDAKADWDGCMLAGTGECPLLPKAQEWAHGILHLGDLSRENGKLSVDEIHNYIAGSIYKHFGDWLIGKGLTHMKKFDSDFDGQFSEKELVRAAHAFLHEERDLTLTLALIY